MSEIKNCVTKDFEMEYFSFGKGPKNFVIIPGLSVQSVMGAKDAVEEGYKMIAGDFTTYVFDRRKILPETYSIHEMAEDTVLVLNQLGLKDIYLFGASQGGMISMDIAINHPDMVKKLVLGSTSSHVDTKQMGIIEKWIDYAEKGDKINLSLSFGEELYPKEMFEQYKDYFIETGKTFTESELKKFIILAEAVKDYDLSKRVKDIQCPTLVIGSYEDSVLDSDATMDIAQNLDFRPDFRLYMYKGYGHAAYDTAPDYRKRIYEFMINGG